MVVYIHGGASIGGDKQWTKDLGIKPVWAMVDLGYVLVSINYRLGAEGEHPKAQKDAANAVAWVYENIEEFGGDHERIAVMGHSAGASLTARIVTDPTFLRKAGDDLDILTAAITIDGGSMRQADGDVPAPVDQVTAGTPPFLSLHVGGGAVSRTRRRWPRHFRLSASRAAPSIWPGTTTSRPTRWSACVMTWPPSPSRSS